jgi:hypothetical protein
MEAAGGNTTTLAAQAATGILQSAALLSGANAWTAQDDEAIVAQGRASAQAAAAFKAFAVPMLEGLGALLSAPRPMMLDVGVGVAAMAVAYCEAFPRLRVVGLDVFPRALELARGIIDDAGMAERVELRCQDVATLEERDVFCLAWLPAPFVPRAAIGAGLPRMIRALVSGGWVVVGHGKFGTGGRSDALTLPNGRLWGHGNQQRRSRGPPTWRRSPTGRHPAHTPRRAGHHGWTQGTQPLTVVPRRHRCDDGIIESRPVH